MVVCLSSELECLSNLEKVTIRTKGSPFPWKTQKDTNFLKWVSMPIKKNPENCIKLIELIFLFQGWGCFGSFYVDHVVLYQSS